MDDWASSSSLVRYRSTGCSPRNVRSTGQSGDLDRRRRAAADDHGRPGRYTSHAPVRALVRHVVAPARYRESPSGAPWHVEDRGLVPPATAGEQAFHNAIRQTHGFSADDFGHTYVTAGCDLDLVPAVVLNLEAAGYSGLTSTMFTAPFTLRRIASALTVQVGSQSCFSPPST
jgi:hypothetical protein